MGHNYSDAIFAAIDIGTTKICVLVGRHLDGDQVEIIGVGKAPSDGLSKGVVVDVAKTIHSIRTAVKEAEIMVGFPISAAAIGISGGHIQSCNSHGVVPITRGAVSAYDVKNVLAAARAIPIPEGMQVLHVLPQYFIIDGRDKVLDPIGMHGIRLEVEAHIIMGALASVQNLVKCCEKAGVMVSDIVLEQLASASAVLSADELQLGVAMLDIGGGTADLAIYHHGSIRHTKVVPIAGNHFTNDLAIGLRTTLKESERLKRLYGFGIVDHETFIDIESVQAQGNRSVVHVQDIRMIIEPRARELMGIIRRNIVDHKLLPFMQTGLVLTGGGSLLHGMIELAQQEFHIPVRLGTPRVQFDTLESLANPIYATSYGLLLHAAKQYHRSGMSMDDGPLVKRVFERMKTWVMDFF